MLRGAEGDTEGDEVGRSCWSMCVVKVVIQCALLRQMLDLTAGEMHPIQSLTT